jgi:hypothetical protein
MRSVPKKGEGDWPHIVHALARVGTDAAARFRWMQDFAARDLTDAATCLAARFEAYAFLLTSGGGERSQPTESELLVRGLTNDPSLLGPEAHRAVRRLQTRLRHMLESLQTQRRWRGDVHITEAVLTTDGRLLLVTSHEEASRFDFGVLGVLMELAPQLRTCAAAGCGRLFLKQGRQAYCSTRCSQRIRTIRFRESHPDVVSQRRHNGYVRRKQKKLGPKVKVGTRRRRRHSAG